MGGPWPMKAAIYSRPSAVSLKVWLRETTSQATRSNPNILFGATKSQYRTKCTEISQDTSQVGQGFLKSEPWPRLGIEVMQSTDEAFIFFSPILQR